MYKYLISVIIPTRNRQRYAEAAARQILALNQDIQVILQDNSDDDSLASATADLTNNEHFVYHHIAERVAFVDNYEIAASYAEGEYFIALGDDDGLLSNITECVLWMKKNGIDAIKPAVSSAYRWPDPASSSQQLRDGVFSTTWYTGKCKRVNTEDAIKQLLEHGGQEYLIFPVAGTYHKVVRMELMKSVKAITGRYYGGLTPDMYSATCLSLLPDIKFVEMDYPISLPGICPSSASAKSSKGEHSGDLSSAPHFIGLKEPYVWDKRIPRYYSVETIWADTFLHAIEDMGRGELISSYFNEDYLLYFLYKNNPNRKNDIENLIGKQKLDSIHVNVKKPGGRINMFINKAYRYVVKRYPGNSVVYSVCKDISDATNEMNRLISSPLMRKRWTRIENARL